MTKTELRHTPGPWRIHDGEQPCASHLVLTSEYPIARESVAYVADNRAQVFVGDKSADRSLANARLIAAAPELLAELQTAWNVICCAAQESQGKVRKEIVGGWLDHAARINAAINKATTKE